MEPAPEVSAQSDIVFIVIKLALAASWLLRLIQGPGTSKQESRLLVPFPPYFFFTFSENYYRSAAYFINYTAADVICSKKAQLFTARFVTTIPTVGKYSSWNELRDVEFA